MDSPDTIAAAAISSGSESAWQGLFFVIVALFLGIFTKHLLAWTKLPFTALLLGIEPTFFLSLLLPIIIYAAAINMHWHTLRRCISQVLLLAGPGVVIGTALTAVFVKYAFPYNWTWIESLLFGAMMSATDPVAVIALLQEVGAEKELRTVIEGESLFNDGTAYVLFLLFEGALQGHTLTPGSVIKQLCQLTIGGPAVGAAFGVLVVIWLRYVYNSAVVEVTMTIVAALGSFIVGNEMLGVSGVLAVLCLGIWMLSFGAHHISREVQEPLNIIWEELEFIANTLIFILAGVIIAGNIYRSENNPRAPAALSGKDYGYAFLLWLALLAIRLCIFMVLYPILKMTGYSITWRKVLVMVWSGLRGAVGLALALYILLDAEIADTAFRVRAFFFMGLIAAITIVVQGTTTGLLLQWLGLTRRVSVKKTFLNNVVRQVEGHGSAHAKLMPHSDLLEPQNWRDITRLTSIDASGLLPRYKSIADIGRPTTDIEQDAPQQSISVEAKRAQLRNETRARLLRAVQQTYEDIFERAHVAPAHLYRLKNSTNRGLDQTKDPLCDWKYVDNSCHVPTWLKLLQSTDHNVWLPPTFLAKLDLHIRRQGIGWFSQLARTQLFRYLEDQAALMLAFHYAHTDAVHSMQHFDLQPQQTAPAQQPQQAKHAQQAESAPNDSSTPAAANGHVPHVQQTAPAQQPQPANHAQHAETGSATVAAAPVAAAPSVNDVLAKEHIIQQVIEESKQQQRLAEHRLHALRKAYPEVLASIRTKQIALEVLLVKEAYVHELQASGLVDSAEMAELVYLVERQKKRLHFGAPTLRVPPLAKELWQHPLFRGLTAQDRAEISAVAKARLFSHGTQLQSGSSADLVFLMRGGVELLEEFALVNPQQAGSQTHHQQQTAQETTQHKDGNGQEPTPEKPGLTHQYSQGRSQQRSKQVLDARGYVLGLGTLLQEQPAAKLSVLCHTAVEVYIVPAKIMQEMLQRLPAFRSRALQMGAAQTALLHCGPLPARLSWTQLQVVFRRSKMEEIAVNETSHLKGPAFLLSGNLQLAAASDSSSQDGVLDGLGRQGNHASATATEQGYSLGASPSLQGGTEQPSEQPRHLSAEGVGSRIHAPAFWHADGTELKCLQDAQVFHLPAEVFAEQPQPTASSSSEASISSFLAEGDERTAVDTGRWGQSDRKPSAFLSHDLWMRLGHT